MNDYHPKYGSTVAIGDRLFAQDLMELSRSSGLIMAEFGTRGFESLNGIAIRPMSERTVQALPETVDKLLTHYEQSFAGPRDYPSPLSAIEDQLSKHVFQQLDTMATSFKGFVDSYEEGLVSADDPFIAQALAHAKAEVQRRVDIIVAKLS